MFKREKKTEEPDNLRNIRLTIEYDGSRYQGWVRLGKDESNNTISNKILEVLRKMTGEDKIELNCGCRTEVGVHAYAQVANFKTASDMKVLDIKHYLNRYLPMDIAITEVKEVLPRFHAQLNALSKTYVYRMTVDDVPSVFDRKYTYHCFKAPDKALMQQAASLLTGTHDFQHFSSARKSKSTVRKLYDIEIYWISDSARAPRKTSRTSLPESRRPALPVIRRRSICKRSPTDPQQDRRPGYVSFIYRLSLL